MRALKLKAEVSEDHTLKIELPDDVTAGPAEVIILFETASTTNRPNVGTTIADFLKRPGLPGSSLRTKEEIDRFLHAEKESWS